MKKLSIGVVLVFCTMATGSPPLLAQSTKPQDAPTLRTKFIAAFGKDFDLVKDELKTRH